MSAKDFVDRVNLPDIPPFLPWFGWVFGGVFLAALAAAIWLILGHPRN